MDSVEFRENGRQLIDYIVEYHDTISERPVTHNVEQGYIKKLISEQPPEEGEPWKNIISDLETVIMPGITHSLHPHFHANFPAGFSYPSFLGDILCEGAASVGFSWVSSPACTELETIVVDWLGDLIGLPQDFLIFAKNSKGGGVLQNSSYECNFTCLLTARDVALRKLKKEHPEAGLAQLATQLVAYCSKEACSAVEKAASMGLVKLKALDTDDEYQLRGSTLDEAIESDQKNGLYPFFVVATMGTFSSTSCDALREIGPVCNKHNVWLHIDADYAGNSLVCPEYRGLLEGIEYASSFSMDPAKWLPLNADCAAMWVKDKNKIQQCFTIDPLYLQHQHEESAVDYRHWGVHLTRRFRSLKIWFAMRMFGIQELQKYIKNYINLAKDFEKLVESDDRYEICNNVRFGVICFRLKANNDVNEKLLDSINESRRLFLTGVTLGGFYVIRFCVCSPHLTKDDLVYAWEMIKEHSDSILESNK